MSRLLKKLTPLLAVLLVACGDTPSSSSSELLSSEVPSSEIISTEIPSSETSSTEVTSSQPSTSEGSSETSSEDVPHHLLSQLMTAKKEKR